VLEKFGFSNIRARLTNLSTTGRELEFCSIEFKAKLEIKSLNT